MDAQVNSLPISRILVFAWSGVSRGLRNNELLSMHVVIACSQLVQRKIWQSIRVQQKSFVVLMENVEDYLMDSNAKSP